MNRRRFFGALLGGFAAVTLKGNELPVPVNEFTGLPMTYQPLSLTLADWAKRMDPNNKRDTIIELLNANNDLLLDLSWENVE